MGNFVMAVAHLIIKVNKSKDKFVFEVYPERLKVFRYGWMLPMMIKSICG